MEISTLDVQMSMWDSKRWCDILLTQHMLYIFPINLVYVSQGDV